MIFAVSLILIITGGVLAVRAETGDNPRRVEVAAGLMLMVGLSLIGWGLNFRH